MLGKAKAIYLATRKKHDQVFNTYFMRPIAAFVVSLIARTSITPNQVTILSLLLMVSAATVLAAVPTWQGGLLGVALLELSYLLDCVDGMLARHKKLASQQGHLFDFFTDELKAVVLTAGLGLHVYRKGGLGLDLRVWPAEDARFLLGTVLAVVVIASAISLTNFVRRPELTGKETPIEAHYETVARTASTSLVARVVELFLTFLRFINHYPSHLWAFAAFGRLEVFFWVYALNNGLYLARGWLGLMLRFGRGGASA
jgi:phosphatidylglycerophosphate synthase